MFAPAKINLSLYVMGRREDGYHSLKSLVTFADVGDDITCKPAEEFSLTLSGEPIDGNLEDNLILKAARLFKTVYPPTPYLAFHLHKNLPVASGIGGGSADAAATLRLMRDITGYHDIMPLAQQLGADVPICILSRSCVMSGIGHDLGEVLSLSPLPALLVNPRIAVSTAAIFKSLKNYTQNPPTLDHNDLEEPAIRFAPVIGTVIEDLKKLDGVVAARMSGSGATCFALFKNDFTRDLAYETYANKHSSYWIKKTTLGLDNLLQSPI